jgi:hypothetical protein
MIEMPWFNTSSQVFHSKSPLNKVLGEPLGLMGEYTPKECESWFATRVSWLNARGVGKGMG